MIFTFYSYKGGVGRSMALANIAELLYRAGLSVLIVDWDLEAPGLECYFTADLPADTLDRPGLLELLLDYKEQMSSPVPDPTPEEDVTTRGTVIHPPPGEVTTPRAESDPDPSFDLVPQEEPDLQAQLGFKHPQEFAIDIHADQSDGAWLRILSAGRREGAYFGSYAQTVHNFDWKDFYANWEGELYFEWLRKQFLGMADVVLIDSRTGLSEISGICTYQMADAVIMFCALNMQNLTGTLQMAHNLTRPQVVQYRHQERPIQVMMVPARVEDRAQEVELAHFAQQFKTTFQAFLPQARAEDPETFWRLKIPYVPYYAFTERTAISEGARGGTQDLVAAYLEIVQLMISFAPIERVKVRNALASLYTRQQAQKDLLPLDPVTFERMLHTGVGQADAPSPAILPAPPGDFTGRATELDRVRRLVGNAQGASRPAVILLQGEDGHGKSTLARQLAVNLQTACPDGHIFLELLGSSPLPLAAEAVLAAAIRFSDPLLPLPPGGVSLRDHFRLALQGRRVLLVLDDAHDADQVRSLIPSAGSILLITSRADFTIPGALRVTVDRLNRTDTITLLRSLCPRLTTAEANRLATICDDHALTCRVAGNYLGQAPTWSVDRYLAALRDEQRFHGITKTDDVSANLASHLQLSWKQLDRSSQIALAQLTIFVAIFTSAAAEDILRLPEEADPHLALDQLVRAGLLDDSGGDHLALHPLVRAFAESHLSAEDAWRTRQRHAHHYLEILRDARSHYLAGGTDQREGLRSFDTQRVETDAAWAWLIATPPTPETEELLLSYLEATGEIGMARYDPEREGLPRWAAARAAAQRLGNRAMEGLALSKLGSTYAALGESHHAIGLHEHHLAIAQNIGDRRGAAVALGNLGSATVALNDLPSARQFYQQQLQVVRELGDPRTEAVVLGNLGQVCQALGEAKQALDYYESQLTIAHDHGDSSGEATALGHRGTAYRDLGHFESALTDYLQQLALFRRLENRRGEAMAEGNIGTLYLIRGEEDEAIPHYMKQLKIARSLADRQAIGEATGNLGSAYYAKKDLRQAISYYEQQLENAQTMHDKRAEAVALGNLGSVHRRMGAIERAVGYYERQVRAAEEAGDRTEASRASWNLGLVLEKHGDLQRAVPLMQAHVTYLRDLAHPDAEQRAARLAATQARLVAGA
jgi:tetratricopeptide (TPR) repeat protein/MinD-like ATPase involved in chromosome partitioning or flagellar assembly